jgi:AcrR family transcriptional regulator
MKQAPTRPLGQPRSFDRGKALLAAMRVFRERGYDGATLADLQAAMGGITPPSLYAAFGSKEELFKEAVSLYVASTGRACGDALEAPTNTTREAIEQMLRASVASITRAGEPHGCLLVLGALRCTTEGEEGAAASEHLHQLRLDTYRRIAQRMKRCVREGDLPRGADVDSLAMFVTALSHGLSVLAPRRRIARRSERRRRPRDARLGRQRRRTSQALTFLFLFNSRRYKNT